MERVGKRSGSIVLMVLIFSTFIMVVATVALRSGTLLYELALDRVTQLKQQRAAQALAYYGIASCRAMKGAKRQSYSLSFDHWPPSDGAYEGSIVVEYKKKGYTIGATLSRQGHELSSIHAEIGQEGEDWQIIDWRNG